MKMGKYAHHKRTREFIKWALTKGLFQVPKHPKNAAHLHMNIKEGYRNQGIGHKLLKEYEKMLIQEGVYHYYGDVISSNIKRTIDLFKKLGFDFYSRVKITAFESEIKEPLYIMCIHKNLK